MPARRCGLCGTNWPTTEAYKTCPECLNGFEEKTDWVQNGNAIAPGDAQRRWNEAKFDQHYRATRGVSASDDETPFEAGADQPDFDASDLTT